MENPAVDQAGNWVWQLHGKAHFPFPAGVFSSWIVQPGSVHTARACCRDRMGVAQEGEAGVPDSDNAGESLFSWQLAKGGGKKGDFRVPHSKCNLNYPQPIAEMSHRTCGANGACVTGKLLVASCKESSHIADTLEQGVR